MKIAIVLAAATAVAFAQPPVPGQAPPSPSAPPPGQYAPAPAPAPQPPRVKRTPSALVLRPNLERPLGPGERWWSNPETAQRVGLTADQRKRMDDIFQQYRLQLVDLDGAVRKAEIVMEPLVSAEQPDEARILAQIDKVAQARADLEKANARMLFDIRRVLTVEQWKKLQAAAPPRPDGRAPVPARARDR